MQRAAAEAAARMTTLLMLVFASRPAAQSMLASMPRDVIRHCISPHLYPAKRWK